MFLKSCKLCYDKHGSISNSATRSTYKARFRIQLLAQRTELDFEFSYQVNIWGSISNSALWPILTGLISLLAPQFVHSRHINSHKYGKLVLLVSIMIIHTYIKYSTHCFMLKSDKGFEVQEALPPQLLWYKELHAISFLVLIPYRTVLDRICIFWGKLYQKSRKIRRHYVNVLSDKN